MWVVTFDSGAIPSELDNYGGAKPLILYPATLCEKSIFFFEEKNACSISSNIISREKHLFYIQLPHEKTLIPYPAFWKINIFSKHWRASSLSGFGVFKCSCHSQTS